MAPLRVSFYLKEVGRGIITSSRGINTKSRVIISKPTGFT
jgi:hypothetical protein